MACGCPKCAGGGSKVQPLRLDSGCKVRPAGVFGCDSGDMFACWAAEHTAAAGTEVDYWWQDLLNSTLDPVYNEPEARLWQGPFRLKAFVTRPEPQFEVREQGSRAVWPGTLWVARLEIEESEMPGLPKEGDVVRFWDLPFYDNYSLGSDLDRNIPGAGYYFDVINAMEDGHFRDSPDFVGFQFSLKRRTEFTPERRVFNQT